MPRFFSFCLEGLTEACDRRSVGLPAQNLLFGLIFVPEHEAWRHIIHRQPRHDISHAPIFNWGKDMRWKVIMLCIFTFVLARWFALHSQCLSLQKAGFFYPFTSFTWQLQAHASFIHPFKRIHSDTKVLWTSSLREIVSLFCAKFRAI